jgi:hypothetical protein
MSDNNRGFTRGGFIKTAGIVVLALGAVAAGLLSASCKEPATDYSQSAHWLSLPAPVKAIDVFYLYPTAWTSTDPNNPQVCAIDEPSMLTQAPAAFARQATAFETVGNIYAPYYRQDNNSSTDRLNVIAGIPTLDAVAAFDYYIKHYNNGRPFILVGHSQGATVLSNLLSGYMKDHPEVNKNMVAAYVIGHPVTQAYLDNNKHLKFATGPDDTGVIISYNTQAPVIGGINPVLYGMVGRVINPINWKTDETLATTAEGQGSFMPVPPNFVSWQQEPQYADARIDKTSGVLICSTADASLWSPGPSAKNPGAFPSGVYHSFDIPFYYYNLRTNAQNRVNKFLGKQ